MEAVGFSHCSTSLLSGIERVSLVRCSSNVGLKLQQSVLFDHSSLRIVGCKSYSRWQSLLPSPTPSHRAVSQQVFLHQRTTNAFHPTSISSYESSPCDEKNLSVEEEEKIVLKRIADGVGRDLRGTCIFLVGMMGTGKIAVGKRLADSLGYYFFDSDKLVEDAAGGIAREQMFHDGREEEFRNAESEVLMQLSSMGRLVVSTGDGAVVNLRNWGYLRHGITVWLDVPVEELAKRMVEGQDSQEMAYDEALKCVVDIFEERKDYFKSADAVVSAAALVRTMGMEDVSSVTPTMLATRVLEEISSLISDKIGSRKQM